MQAVLASREIAQESGIIPNNECGSDPESGIIPHYSYSCIGDICTCSCSPPIIGTLRKRKKHINMLSFVVLLKHSIFVVYFKIFIIYIFLQFLDDFCFMKRLFFYKQIDNSKFFWYYFCGIYTQNLYKVTFL